MIDFRTIRTHRGSQETGFEELTRQLVLAEPLPPHISIEHRGPGADGGVEVLVRFADGTSWGWQSKFWLDGFGESQVQQAKKSFESSLDHYGPADKGGLTLYFVALPVNISGSGTAERDDARKRWNAFLSWAEAKSKAVLGRAVSIETWDETALIERLQRHEGPYPGMRAYWFDQLAFTPTWFREKLDNAIAALDERYHPEDHVDVNALRVFDVALRRPSVKRDLHRDFVEARAIYPITADLMGVGLPSPEPHELATVNAALARFVDLEAAVDQPIVEPWPVAEWNDAWRGIRFWELNRSWERALEAGGHKLDSELSRKLWDKLHLPAQTREVFGSPWHFFLTADGKRAILFTGVAGTGKSHLLAKAGEDALAEGAPALLLLGQDFVGNDPRAAILSRLDLPGRSFEVLLGTLDAAATAADTRCLILIDALNEGRGTEIWQRELSRLLVDIRKFPRLILAVSCRSEYLDATVPESLRDSFEMVEVEGFRSFEEQEHAAQVYMDRRGIIRPASPSLDPEFSNPLFLRIACEALVKSGQHVFPRGLRGAKRIFRFVFETRGRFLGTSRDGTDDLVAPLIRSLQTLAAAMAAARVDFLHIPEATALINGVFASYPAPVGKTWLDVLRGNNFLRKDIFVDSTDDEFQPKTEVVRFTFQRLSDHLMAEALLAKVTDIDRAFLEGGPLSFVIERSYQKRENPRLVISMARGWEGLCEALWIAIAEQYERELIDLTRDDADAQTEVVWHRFEEEFCESVRWRESRAFTARTQEVALWLLDDFGRKRLGLYLELALVPGHPWNIERLHRFLAGTTMPERDSQWSTALTTDYSKASQSAYHIVDWFLNADLSQVDDDVQQLGATTLGWFFSVTDRALRDRATKAMARLFLAYPGLIAQTLGRFMTVADEYVRERVLAAAYGALLHIRSNAHVLGECASAAFALVFSSEETCRHMTLRDYARGIIEVAAARNALPSAVDIARCRPPYRSRPIVEWPAPLEIKKLTEERDAGSIFSSTVGWIDEDGRPSIAGDFGRYTMGGISSSFSAEPRVAGPPATPGRPKDAFWAEVQALGAEAARVSTEMLALRQEIENRAGQVLPMVRIEDDDGGIEVVIERWNKKDPEIAGLFDRLTAYEAELKALLPPPLLTRFEKDAVLPEHGDNRPLHFSLIKGQCWVAWRALDLGWSKENHGDAERNFSYEVSRSEHRVERIGKKYQWIAYQELCGYLIDHHWYFSDWNDTPVPFDRVDPFDRRDIDPSFWLAEDATRTPDARVPLVSLPATDFRSDNVDAAMAWAENFDDIHDPLPVIETLGPDHRRWWLTHHWHRDNDYMKKHQSTGAFRTAQTAISLILLRQSDLDRFVLAAKGRNFGNDSMLGSGHTYPGFVGEYGFDTGVISAERDGEPYVENEYEKVPYFSANVNLDGRRGAYDFSNTLKEAFTAPAPWLVQAMELRSEGPLSPAFAAAVGTPVFLDVSIGCPNIEAVLVDANKLEHVLAARSLTPLWLFWCEKDGGLGHGGNFAADHQRIARSVFGGCYWRAGGVWQSELWKVARDY